ncbi:MAG: GNAT family N-acetyltransferase [Chloroflexota bacterium]
MSRIVDLELAIWGLKAIDTAPTTILAMASHTGGSVFVAENHEGDLVGFCVGFRAMRDNISLLWSHMAGVHPDYQGYGVGTSLKMAQHKWAGDVGYDAVGWTFDPLQAGNANFNLNALGAVGVAYHKNFYGEMQDAINKTALPSDRLEARWWTKKPQNHNSSDGNHYLVFALDEQSDSPLATDATSIDADAIGIRIPEHKSHANVQQWQAAICRVFEQSLSLGYEATGFVRDSSFPYYVLTRR